MAVRDSFRTMAGVYDRYRSTDPRVYEVLAGVVKLSRGGGVRMLDVGCGTGNLSTELAGEYSISLTGIDLTPEMIAQAATKHPKGTWIIGDFEMHSFSGEFDFILMSYVLHHLKAQKEAVEKATALLAPGGRLAIVTDDLDQFTKSRMHQLIPRMIEIDIARFPSVETITGWIQSLGLKTWTEEVTRVDRYETRAYVERQTEKIRARYVSTLTLLTDEELEAGARAYEAYLLSELDKGPIEVKRTKTIILGEKAK